MKAKRIMCLCLSLLSPLFFAAFFTDTARADIISERINQCLNAYRADPWPDPNDANDPTAAVSGKSGYALACLYQGKDITKARQYVNDICNFANVGGTGYPVTEFQLPIVWRIYCDPTCFNNLDQPTKDKVEATMWTYVVDRSKISSGADRPTSRVWDIHGSENHDMFKKACLLVALYALENAGSPYGPTRTLTDGSTVDQHLQAWQKYFFEYFRQRAREGISCEIASPIYNKYTVGNWYNVRDFSGSSDLQSYANDFLTLFWADYVGDYLPFSGLRGGAKTRWYKDMISGSADSFSGLLYAYNWNDIDPGSMHPSELMMLTSSYRNPAWLDALGGNPNRTPTSVNTTRRFGKASYYTYDGNDTYHITFDANNASQLRRDTWWHRDYVMGSLSLKTDTALYYSDLINQNRGMGIYYDCNGVDERLIFTGSGDTYSPDYTIGFTEVAGVCGKDCMVAAWDKNARHVPGMFIYVPYGALLNNKADANNWIFTKTGPYGCNGRQFVADVNSTCIRNELLLGVNSSSSFAATAPAVVSGGYPSGSCADFNGVSNVAYAVQGWKSYDSVKADFWFNADTTAAGTRVLLNAPSTWEITVSNRNLTFTAYNNSTGSRALKIDNAFKMNTWSHVTASVNTSGRMDLTVDANVCTPRTDPNVLKLKTTDIVFGNKPGATRFFDGKIDTVNISIPSSGKCVGAWNMDAAYTKDVYTGVRIATGGYTASDDTVAGGGKRLVLNTKESPVVFQLAPAQDWVSSNGYTGFKNALLSGNPRHWWYDANSTQKHLTYIALDGKKYEYWANSGKRPKIDDVNVNLNPNETYKGAYVNGNHGMDTVTITDGTNSKTLNFNYTKSPNWDDYQTVALWHMDSIASNKVTDDDLENSARNNDLTVYNSPTLVSGPLSNFGNALSFNGSTQYGQAGTNWNSYKTAKVDCWFKAGTTSGNHALVDANMTWQLRQQNTDLVWYVWWGPSYCVNNAIVTGCITNTTTWHHVTATVDASGVMSLTVDNTTVAGTPGTYYPVPMVLQNAAVTVGRGGGMYFNGSLDDVKISKYSTP